MSFLVLSRCGDDHAQIVTAAAQSLGLEAIWFKDDEFPSVRSLSIDPLQADVEFGSAGKNFHLSQFTAVWNRRFGKADLPHDLHPDDQAIAQRECDAILGDIRALGRFAGPNQSWYNPPASQDEFDCKAVQLGLAQRCGIAVPATLISTDPTAIRKFANEHGACVVKPIRGMAWISDRETRALPARLIGLQDLHNDASLSACPMIYQQPIRKAAELRVVFFDGQFLTVEIERLTAPAGGVDWRASSPRDVDLTEVELSPPLKQALSRYCEMAGLRHCSFDIAVDADGAHWFLECNVQGQCLWIERFNPSIRVLNRLIAMLGSPCGLEPGDTEALRLADFIPAAAEMVAG